MRRRFATPGHDRIPRRGKVHFGHHRDVGRVKNRRIFQRFVFAFGDRSSTTRKSSPRSKSDGTNQIADVFNHQQIEGVQIQLPRGLGNHFRVQMQTVPVVICTTGMPAPREPEASMSVARSPTIRRRANVQRVATQFADKEVLPEPGEETTFRTSNCLARKNPRFCSASRSFFS